MNIEDGCPEWARPTVKKLREAGFLKRGCVELHRSDDDTVQVKILLTLTERDLSKTN